MLRTCPLALASTPFSQGAARLGAQRARAARARAVRVQGLLQGPGAHSLQAEADGGQAHERQVGVRAQRLLALVVVGGLQRLDLVRPQP